VVSEKDNDGNRSLITRKFSLLLQERGGIEVKGESFTVSRSRLKLGGWT
jgi:hypothetical protein